MIEKSKNLSFFDASVVLILVTATSLFVQMLFGVLSPFLIMTGIDLVIVNYIATAFMQVCFAAVVIIFCVRGRRKIDIYPYNRVRRKAFEIPVAIGAGFVIAIVCLLTFYQPAALFQALLEKAGFDLGDSFTAPDSASAWALIAVTCLFAPVVEETVFRGVLLSGMRTAMGKWSAVLLNGLMFSLYHMNPSQTVYQFFLGCACALAAYESASIIPSVAIHFANNMIASLMEIFPAFESFFAKIMGFFAGGVGLFLVVPVAVVGIAAIIILSRLLSKLRDRSISGELTEPHKGELSEPFAGKPLEPYTDEFSEREQFDEDELSKEEHILLEEHNLSESVAKRKQAKIIFCVNLGVCGFVWVIILIMGIIVGALNA